MLYHCQRITKSTIVLGGALLLPPALLGLVLLFNVWVADDYRVLPRLTGQSRGSKLLDVVILAGCVLIVGLVVAFGGVVASAVTPGWAGWVTAGVMLLVLFTALPVVHWYNTFETTHFMWGCIAMAGLLHVAIHIGIWIAWGAGGMPFKQATLALSAVLYPSFVCLALAVVRLREDGWQGSECVVGFVRV